MLKSVKQELEFKYVKDFMDINEELPNDLSPVVSQLLELDSKVLKQIDKIEHKMSKFADPSHTRNKYYLYRIKKYMKKVQKINNKKLKLAEKLAQLIRKSEKQLVEDREGLLLCNQTESFTYGTRSGRLWTASITGSKG